MENKQLLKLKNWNNFKSDEIILKGIRKTNSKKFEKNKNDKLHFGNGRTKAYLSVGLSMINTVTAKKLAESYLIYLYFHIKKIKDRGIVISHNGQKYSKELADAMAQRFSSDSIKVFSFKDKTPMPISLTSFAIKKLSAAAGIYIKTFTNNIKETEIIFLDENGGYINDTPLQSIKNDYLSNEYRESNNHLKYKYISDKLIEEYKSKILKTRIRNSDSSILSVHISPLNGTASKIAPLILAKMDIGYRIPKKESIISYNQKDLTKYILRNIRYYSKKEKCSFDIGIAINTSADDYKLIIQSKLNNIQIDNFTLFILYYEFYLSSNYKKIKLDDHFIVCTRRNKILNYLAKKYNTNVLYAQKNSNDFYNKIHNQKGKLIMAWDENIGQIMNKNISLVGDSINFMVSIIDMMNYYKTQSISLKSKLSELDYIINKVKK